MHRDINPANVILTTESKLRLVDFGCARSMEDGRSMEVMLTPGFAPTEQYSRHGQGPFTDVYALCATLYFCLTAQVPPSSSDRANADYQGLPDPLRRPSELGVVLPEGAENALMHGLEISSQDRTQTMGALADELEAVARPRPPVREKTVTMQVNIVDEPVAAPVEHVVEGEGSWWSRWGVTIVVAIFVIVGIAFLLSSTLLSGGTA